MLNARLLSFEGRMRRSQWWVTQLGLLLGPGLAFFAAVYVFSGVDGEGLAVRGLLTALAILILVAILWVNLATTTQRFHDQGLSGWFYLLSLIPMLGSFILIAMLGFRDSTRGPNRFGSSQKYPVPTLEIFD